MVLLGNECTDLASPYLASIPDAAVVAAGIRWTSAAFDYIHVSIVRSADLDYQEVLRVAQACAASVSGNDDDGVRYQVSELPSSAFGGPAMEPVRIGGIFSTYGLTVRSGDYLVFVTATTDRQRTHDVMRAVLHR